MGKIAVPIALVILVFWVKLYFDEDQFFLFCWVLIVASILTALLGTTAWARMRLVPRRASVSQSEQEIEVLEEPEPQPNMELIEQQVRSLLVLLPPKIAELERRVETHANPNRVRMSVDGARFHLDSAQAIFDTHTRPNWRLMLRLLQHAEGCRMHAERLYDKLLR